MNKISRFLFLLLSFTLLVSCSVSEKQESPSQSSTPEIETTNENELISQVDPKHQTGEFSIDVLPRMHTHLPEQQVEPEPKRVEQRALTHSERFSGMLESHNKIRAKHRLPPLKWSNRLANYSQQWANQMARGSQCQMYHRSGTPPFGENLYRSSAIVWSDGRREINPVTIKEVVKAWTDEERWYNYNRNSCTPGQQCGHYTQAVWKSTTEVGCAMKVCADKSQTWVCSYNPPGNYTGVRPY